jgi:omega-amidase
MRIAILQIELAWQNAAANRSRIADYLAQHIAHPTDLIVLPEMFSTGFTMAAAACAETMQGDTMAWLRKLAHTYDAAVVGSLIIAENSNFYNRLVFMQPDGTFFCYDKRHLFGLAGETEHYTAGTEKLLVTWRGWRIMPLICYDLRFPVWSRNTQNYDLLLYIANWPARRATHWQTLLRARAIENQAYTVGVNVVGTDGNGLYYSGDSAIITPLGDTVVQISNGTSLYQTTLSRDTLTDIRAQLPFLQDRD